MSQTSDFCLNHRRTRVFPLGLRHVNILRLHLPGASRPADSTCGDGSTGENRSKKRRRAPENAVASKEALSGIFSRQSRPRSFQSAFRPSWFGLGLPVTCRFRSPDKRDNSLMASSDVPVRIVAPSMSADPRPHHHGETVSGFCPAVRILQSAPSLGMEATAFSTQEFLSCLPSKSALGAQRQNCF